MSRLVNRTPVPARLAMGAPVAGAGRLGLLIAKATFRARAGGTLELDGQAPEAIRECDEPSELGVLPTDVALRDDSRMEVLIYGWAKAPRAKAVHRMTVGVQVGDVAQRMAVVGNRKWAVRGDRFVATAPEPFVDMPLTWQRTYGGGTEVDLSPTVRAEFRCPDNPDGVGFLPFAEVDALRSTARFEVGYPRFAVEGVALPNLVGVDEGVSAPRTKLAPCCWTAVPFNSALFVAAAQADGVPPLELGTRAGRAHPSWRIRRPQARAAIRAEGFSDDIWRTEIPALRVFADYRSGSREGCRALLPQSILLYPNERRLVVVYRRVLRTDGESGPLSFRLRVGEGWAPEH